MISFLTDITVDGVALWVVLLICVGVFLGAFMDAIAGGGGIITVPTYLMGLSNLPIYNALGTNKLSSGIGTIFSTARFIHQGLVDWKLFAPAVILSLTGSVCGTWLQHHTPAVVLKYLLLVVLPVVAFITLRTRKWPDETAPLDPWLRRLIIWGSAFVIGGYDGYYGPGTGTFMMIALVRFAKLDTRPPRGRRRKGGQSGLQSGQPVHRPAGRVCAGGRWPDLLRGVHSGALYRCGSGYQKRQQDRPAHGDRSPASADRKGRQRAFIPGILELRCVICVRKRPSVF